MQNVTSISEIVRVPTWDNPDMGVSMSNRAVSDALKDAKLDYTVTLEPIFNKDGVQIPDRRIATRSDGHMYDVVSSKFEVVQNSDAFDFVNYIDSDVEIVKAGETVGGMVYMIGKLPSQSVLGDDFTPYVIFRNGFTGKVKISAAITPLRVVCQNQFNFAFKNCSNTVNVRHVANAETKLLEARETLQTAWNVMGEVGTLAERMTKKKVDSDKVIDLLFPLSDDMNSFARHNQERQRDYMRMAVESEDNLNFKGTGWALVNAYTDMMTHLNLSTANVSDRKRAESKFMNTTFKDMNKILDVVEAA